MNLREAAKTVLIESHVPMTANEIWKKIVEHGLDKQINSKGKTPDATIGAWLYVESNKDGGAVSAVGSKPRKFVLSSEHTTATPNSAGNMVVLKSPVHSIQDLSLWFSQGIICKSCIYHTLFEYCLHVINKRRKI